MRKYSRDDYAFLSPASEIIEEARKGRMFILVDNEDRENEGDIVIPAQMATPDVINFMAIHARGLICLALTAGQVEVLGLKLMPAHNQQRHQTAFTTSIEASEGVTTGISAHDRAHTISVAINPKAGPGDISTPGHVFPLLARDGGVLVRAGHTEAIVDIARLAGLTPAGVVCEVMKEDGTMARLPDLIAFAQKHSLKIGAIGDLIAYRRRHDNLIRRTGPEGALESDYGGAFRTIVYESRIDHTRHAALIRGDISTPEPVLVRMHVANVGEDMLGAGGGRSTLLRHAMEMIAAEGRGVLVLLQPRWRPLLPRPQERAAIAGGQLPAERLVEYGAGAQILLDLGVSDMILLSDTKLKIVGLQGYGLRVVEQRPVLRGGGQ